MKMYRMVKLMEVGPGTVVKLDDAQAKRRKPRLDVLGEGRYRTKDVMQFKVGEVVGIEAEIPKAHLDRVELIDEHVGDAPPAAKFSKKEKLAL